MTNKKFVLHANFKPAGQQPEAIEQLVAGINNGLKRQVLLGVTGCGKTFVLANAIEKVQRPALIIAHNKTLAAQLYSEMRSFFPENTVEYFVSYYDYYQPEAYLPASDTYIEKDAAINEQIEQMRLSATKAILERHDTIIVASVSAIYGLGDPKSYLKMVLHLSKGETIKQGDLLKRLAELQYTRNDLELQRGTYRVHGEVIDIFPAEEEKEAVRLELFDDEIANIFYFDPLTGKSLRKLPRITIFPKTHYATPRQTIVDAVTEIKQELAVRLVELHETNKLVEAQRLKERTQYDIEMLLELGYCTGIENYSRYLSKRAAGEPPPTLMDYLPADALLVIDESHVTIPQLGGMSVGDRSRKEVLVNYGFRLPSALDNRPLRFNEFNKIAPQTIYVSATPGMYEREAADAIIELLVRPTGIVDPLVTVIPAAEQVDDLLMQVKRRVAVKERVLVTTLTKKMSESLTEYLVEQGIKARYLHSDIDTIERVEILRDLRLGTFDVLVGINLLREGLDLPEVSLVAILDADKEGFLRSTQSLIQVSGRAARNVNGAVIMYADRTTRSMQQAIDEMQRRTSIQFQFNADHDIVPKSIIKPLPDDDRAYIMSPYPEKVPERSVEMLKYLAMDAKELSATLKNMEREMFACARNLEFEKAAKLRDQVMQIKNAIVRNEI